MQQTTDGPVAANARFSKYATPCIACLHTMVIDAVLFAGNHA